MRHISFATAVVACLVSGAALACEDHAMTGDRLVMAPAATQKPMVVQQADAQPAVKPTAKAKVAKGNHKPLTTPSAKAQLTTGAGSSGG